MLLWQLNLATPPAPAVPLVWPASLPALPLVDDYRESFGKNTIRTTMGGGPTKRRRRFAALADPHHLSFHVDGTQLATFKSFYRETILHGSLPFEYTHPTELVAGVWTLLDEPEVAALGGDYYQVSFSAERIG